MQPLLRRVGLRGWHLQCASLGAVLLCVSLWVRAKTVDQSERGNAERRAIFVGLWPPLLWLAGETVERHPTRSAHAGWWSRATERKRA